MENDAYFNTEEGIRAYEIGEPRNVKYNLDLLASEGITPAPMKGKNVLDMGCGFGLLLKKFHDADARCFGTDISQLAVSRCRKRYPDVRVEVADCTVMPFGEKFSLVMSFGLLGLVRKEDHRKFFKNAFECLEEGGILFVTAPNAERPAFMDIFTGKRNPKTHANARTAAQWRNMLEEAGFRDVAAFPVLRLAKMEKVFGRNIFVKVGTGDPIVIKAKK
jgi:SAM-dependent methyltransferase